MKKKHNRLFDKNLILILFCGGIFAFPYCFRAFWWDESITLINFIQLPFYDIYKQYTIANNHIAYSIVLKLWDICSGDLFIKSELHYRIFSVMIGLSALVVIYSFIKRIFSKKTAFFITLIFAVSQPFAIYSTAIRGYMFSFLFISITLYSTYYLYQKDSYLNRVIYFFSTLLTIAIMPSNILGIYIGILGIIPFADNYFKNKQKLTQIFFNKKQFYIFFVPIIVFLIFYLPLWDKLFAIAVHNSGTVSVISSISNIYLGFFLAFFPLICLLIFVLLHQKIANSQIEGSATFDNVSTLQYNLKKSYLGYGAFVLFICCPLIILTTGRVVAFPRLFFQLWPLGIIYCANILEWCFGKYILLKCRKNKLEINELEHNMIFNSRLHLLYIGIILFWGGLMLNCNYLLSDMFFYNGLYDDFLSPYYLRNYNPKKMILDLKELSSNSNIPVYVSESTDFASIILYSTILEQKKLFNYVKLPMMSKSLELPKGQKFYYIATFNENINAFAHKHNLDPPILIKNYKFQYLYLFRD
jgi:hypothetical protein